MNVLFSSPLGALLARPWVDPVGLWGLRRWYMPLSRLWAAANAAHGDVSDFRQKITPLSSVWPDRIVQSLLHHHERARLGAEAGRRLWEEAIFGQVEDDFAELDRRRRITATRHLATRGAFSPLLFPRRPPVALWRIDSPNEVRLPLDSDADLDFESGLAGLSTSRSFTRNDFREYWLRGPTPSARLRTHVGSETLYARVVEPVEAEPTATLIIGSGLCLESELLAIGRDPAARLARQGWRVVEPISPYHGLRAMPGFYGGEPFFAFAPGAAIDLIAGQASETGLLTAWVRARFGGPVAVAGISMSSFVAQRIASICDRWAIAARPDAVMLISHSASVEDVTFHGALASALGLGRALAIAGWTREALSELSAIVDPASQPAISPSRIVSVLGETDTWLPYDGGNALAQSWQLPADNRFVYRLGHLGMPVQLARNQLPFERLMQVLQNA